MKANRSWMRLIVLVVVFSIPLAGAQAPAQDPIAMDQYVAATQALAAASAALESVQSRPPVTPAEGSALSATSKQKQYSHDMVITERISIILLAVVSVVFLLTVLYYISRRTHRASDLIVAAGLISIVFGTLILVLVCQSLEQLTPAIGILGAIGGYLFGASHERRNATENDGASDKGSPLQK